MTMNIIQTLKVCSSADIVVRMVWIRHVWEQFLQFETKIWKIWKNEVRARLFFNGQIFYCNELNTSHFFGVLFTQMEDDSKCKLPHTSKHVRTEKVILWINNAFLLQLHENK